MHASQCSHAGGIGTGLESSEPVYIREYQSLIKTSTFPVTQDDKLYHYVCTLIHTKTHNDWLFTLLTQQTS